MTATRPSTRVQYLQIAAIGLPFSFLPLGGQGYLRGIADLSTPLVIEVVANSVNIVLVTLFVYGFGWGIQGSARGTVIAQAGMGIAFIVVMLRAARGDARLSRDLMRRLLVVGRHLSSARRRSSAPSCRGRGRRRFGDASLAAHQIAFSSGSSSRCCSTPSRSRAR